MQPTRLRFVSSSEHPDFPLEVGMHHVGHVDGGLGVVAEGADSIACFCVDRRGVWLTVGDGRDGVHVNGRAVRRLAMLRVGDSVYVDGHELRLVGSPAPVREVGAAGDGSPDPRIVLRGLGGRHHGRSFTLDVPRLIGRAAAADIRIDDPAFAERHARIELSGGQVWLRDLGSEEGSVVNGESVRDAVLLPGDQVVFDANDRFVVEAPRRDVPRTPLPLGGFDDVDGFGRGGADGSGAGGRSRWRLPLVLLAALLIAGLLSLLLLYGAG